MNTSTTAPSPEAVKNAHAIVEAQVALLRCPGWLWMLEQMVVERDAQRVTALHGKTPAEREEARVRTITLEQFMESVESTLNAAIATLTAANSAYQVPAEFAGRVSKVFAAEERKQVEASEHRATRMETMPSTNMHGLIQSLMSRADKDLLPKTGQ